MNFGFGVFDILLDLEHLRPILDEVVLPCSVQLSDVSPETHSASLFALLISLSFDGFGLSWLVLFVLLLFDDVLDSLVI